MGYFRDNTILDITVSWSIIGFSSIAINQGDIGLICFHKHLEEKLLQKIRGKFPVDLTSETTSCKIKYLKTYKIHSPTYFYAKNLTFPKN